MKVYFSENVLLNKEDENYNLIQMWLDDLYEESEWSSYVGGYMVECDSIFYDESYLEGVIKINGELWGFDMEGLFGEEHLEMWGFEDFTEIPAGYIFEIVEDDHLAEFIAGE